jgi:hypothetical protein
VKKFGFLVPVAAAAAALSGEAAANVADSPSIPTAQNSVPAVRSTDPKMTESFYVKGDELHSLMMRPSESGQVFAWHTSHSSHSSHQSHRSGS